MTTNEAPERLRDRVRKLLAKAEAEGVTPPEAQALTAKAAELMARYGIDRALLAAARPETDAPGSRLVDLDNPWKRVKAHLLCGLGAELRCQCILLTTRAGLRVHIFGYDSDIERTDVLYTSVLVQMSHGLLPRSCRSGPARGPGGSPGCWASAVIGRVKAAEQAAQATAEQHQQPDTGKSTALVVADRSLVIKAAVQREYPVTRAARTTYSGTGYGAGYEKGQRADLGTRRISERCTQAIDSGD